MIISLEGLDGSGKSHQAYNIAMMLNKRAIPYEIFREPGGTDLGESVRRLLKSNDMDKYTELLLFSAARNELVQKKVKPAIEYGKVVIFDRFWDSTIAYQAAGRGIDIRDCMRLIEMVAGDLTPDLTFYFDIPPHVSIDRSSRRDGQDRFDTEDLQFKNRVRQSYLSMVSDSPDRFVLVDATHSVEHVRDFVISTLSEKLKEHTG